MRKLKLFLPLAAIAVISIILIDLFYQSYSPYSGLKLKYDSDKIKIKAEKLLKKLEIPVEDLQSDIKLYSNNSLLRQVEKQFGLEKGNKLIREGIPVYYWRVRFMKRISSIFFSSGNDNPETQNLGKNEIEVYFNAEGEFVQLNNPVKDSLQEPAVSYKTAIESARKFITENIVSQGASAQFINDSTLKVKAYGALTLFESTRREETNNEGYDFVWKGSSSKLKDPVKLLISLQGKTVSKYNLSYEVPEEFSEKENGIFKAFSSIIFFVIIYILIILIAYKKIKASEISFKLAFIMSVIVAVSFGFEFYTRQISDMGWEILIPLILGGIFYGIGVLFTWGVGESVARESWKEKFISLDLVTKGYFFDSKVGASIINGISGGFLLMIIWTLLLIIINYIPHSTYIFSGDSVLSQFHSETPGFNIITGHIHSTIFLFTIFILFVVAGLRRRFSSLTILIIIGSILWGLVEFNNYHPIYIAVISEIIIGAVIILIFYRYDVLTTLFAMLSFFVIDQTAFLFNVNNTSYAHSGYTIVVTGIILIIIAAVALFTKDRIIDYNSITPAFVKNITERQRLQRELEIARDVQMSFLPQEDPNFPGLEVASRCLPALEVGGDYYDFVKLDDKKLELLSAMFPGRELKRHFI